MRGWSLVALSLVACDGTRAPLLWRGDAASDAARPVVDAGEPGDAGTETLVIEGELSTTLYGAEHGDPFTDLCGASEALVGFEGAIEPEGDAANAAGPFIGALMPRCARIGLRAGRLRRETTQRLPQRGRASDAPWAQTCPIDEVVVGFSGRSGEALDRLRVICAPFTLEGNALVRGAARDLEPAGGDGGIAFYELCADGQLARGVTGSAGQWIDALAFVCGTPQTTP